MRYYSRDETEFGSFGDRYVSQPLTALPTFGGLFDKLFKPVKKKVATKLESKGATKSQVASFNKAAASVKPTAKGFASMALAPVKATVTPKLTASLAKQGASPAQVALLAKTAARAQPTLSDLAKGFGRSAATMAPVVAPVVGPAISAAAAPAVRAVAPAVRAVAPSVKLAAPTVSAAVKLGGSALAAAATRDGPRGAPVFAPALAPVFAPTVPVRAQPIAVRRDLPIARGFAPAAAARAIKYLVLDSGQVLSGASAQQRVSGFAVWNDGQVSRQ